MMKAKQSLLPTLIATITIITYLLGTIHGEELNSTGQKLESGYNAQMDALKAELTSVLSQLDEKEREVYIKARQAEAAARKAFEEVNQVIKGGVKGAQNLVNHAKDK